LFHCFSIWKEKQSVQKLRPPPSLCNEKETNTQKKTKNMFEAEIVYIDSMKRNVCKTCRHSVTSFFEY